MAAIIRETSKAYLFLLVDIPGKPSLWFPKSTVISMRVIGQTKLREVWVKPWILKEKNQDLKRIKKKYKKPENANMINSI